MAGKTVSAEVRLLSAQVRLGDEKTLKRIVAELKRAKGDTAVASAALGISVRTLQQWGRAPGPLKDALKEHSRGRGRPRKPAKRGRKSKAAAVETMSESDTTEA
jgi:uncharacterized protein HemY